MFPKTCCPAECAPCRKGSTRPLFVLSSPKRAALWEQPCSGCGLLEPGLASLEDDVGGLDELAHDGDDDELGGLAARGEALGEGFQRRIASFGLQAGEIEHASRPGPAA